MVCAWPGTEFGYLLESSSLLGTTNWITNAAPVVMTNDQNTVALPRDAAMSFFRLRKPPLPKTPPPQ